MTTPAPPGIIRPGWPGAYGTDFQSRVLSTIVEGAPFSRSLTPMPTQRGSVAFGILDTEDPEWIGELGVVPDLAKDQSAYEVAVSKLAGSILVSIEALDDADWQVTPAITQVIYDTFSNKLDRDLIGAAGPMPVPTGVLSVAAEVTAADWELAAIAAKAAISTAGGTASHIALNPAVFGAIESARDETGRALYSDVETSFAGLVTVRAVAATQPIVYAADRIALVVRKDFSADVSAETDSAWRHYAKSLRMVGRFAVACPQPSKAVRKLALTAPERSARASGKARLAPADAALTGPKERARWSGRPVGAAWTRAGRCGAVDSGASRRPARPLRERGQERGQVGLGPRAVLGGPRHGGCPAAVVAGQRPARARAVTARPSGRGWRGQRPAALGAPAGVVHAVSIAKRGIGITRGRPSP